MVASLKKSVFALALISVMTGATLAHATSPIVNNTAPVVATVSAEVKDEIKKEGEQAVSAVATDAIKEGEKLPEGHAGAELNKEIIKK